MRRGGDPGHSLVLNSQDSVWFPGCPCLKHGCPHECGRSGTSPVHAWSFGCRPVSVFGQSGPELSRLRLVSGLSLPETRLSPRVWSVGHVTRSCLEFWLSTCVCFSDCTHTSLSIYDHLTLQRCEPRLQPQFHSVDFAFVFCVQEDTLNIISLTRCFACSWLRLETRVFACS